MNDEPLRPLFHVPIPLIAGMTWSTYLREQPQKAQFHPPIELSQYNPGGPPSERYRDIRVWVILKDTDEVEEVPRKVASEVFKRWLDFNRLDSSRVNP